MSLIRLTLFFFSIVFVSCSSENNGRIITSNNFELQFHELSNNSKSLFKNCILNTNLLATDRSGNIVFSSENFSLQGVSSFYYDSILLHSPLNQVFEETFEGDSLSFKLTASDFFTSFFGSYYRISGQNIDLKDTLLLQLRILGFNTISEQDYIYSKLSLDAIQSEKRILNTIQNEWDMKYVNIFKYRDLYSIKLSSFRALDEISDSVDQYISINYSITDLYGRLLYQTGVKGEYYDKSLNDQLLDGFEVLVDKYNRGDSVVAIMPSGLLFGERGSFVNQIPPFTAVKINLRIN